MLAELVIIYFSIDAHYYLKNKPEISNPTTFSNNGARRIKFSLRAEEDSVFNGIDFMEILKMCIQSITYHVMFRVHHGDKGRIN